MDDHPSDERIRSALREHYGADRFPRDEIKTRIDQSVRLGRVARPPRSALRPWGWTALAAAAALVTFVAGAEYGRRSAIASVVATETTPVSGPIAIQSAGSEYVARLAEFTATAPSLSEAERAEARQVALAILYAATIEILRETEDDELLSTVARMIFSRRQSLRNPENAGAVWF